MQITNTIPNEHNNKILQVDIYATHLSASSRADQYLVYDEISYSYNRTKSYPTDSVVFKGGKLRLGINFSTDDFKAPSTPRNSSSSSVISCITTTCSFRNIDQNDSSLKIITQFQSSNFFSDN